LKRVSYPFTKKLRNSKTGRIYIHIALGHAVSVETGKKSERGRQTKTNRERERERERD